jgi:hypothetical protein
VSRSTIGPSNSGFAAPPFVTWGLSPTEVQVEVESGVATLRGSVDSRSLADDLVTRVEKVPGVRGVAAMIRVTAATS